MSLNVQSIALVSISYMLPSCIAIYRLVMGQVEGKLSYNSSIAELQLVAPQIQARSVF